MQTENPYKVTRSDESPSISSRSTHILNAVLFALAGIASGLISVTIREVFFGPPVLFSWTVLAASTYVTGRRIGFVSYIVFAGVACLAYFTAAVLLVTIGLGKQPFARTLAAFSIAPATGAIIVAVGYELLLIRRPRAGFVVAVAVAGFLNGAIAVIAIEFGLEPQLPAVAILGWQMMVAAVWGFYDDET